MTRRHARCSGPICHPECVDVLPYCHHALAAACDEAWRAHELDADLARERELACELLDHPDDEPPWPWYADEPCEVVEPEVFEP